MVTKSATNQFHGEAYEFHDDNAIRARNFFNPVGYHKPKDILNQFGGNIGGPIMKNKLFFFGDFERTPGSVVPAGAPSSSFRAVKAARRPP